MPKKVLIHGQNSRIILFYCCGVLLLPIHFAPGALYDWGCITPTQSPKHLCWTLNEVGSPRGGETAGEDGGGGGDEGERDRWLGSSFSSREQSRSASDFVISPHWAAEIGSTRANFRDAS